MVEPTTILSDYRQSGIQPKSFAPIYQTQKNIYDGKAMLERTQKRIQEAQRKRGNLVEGRMRQIAKEPKKAHKISISQKPIIQPEIKPAAVAAASKSNNSIHSNTSTKKQTSKIILELPISNTKIGIKAAQPPSVRKNDLKPQPNANNDWSTNYNDDFRNWQGFRAEIKKKPLEEFVTVGSTATHHLNAEKRKYMERINREEKAKSLQRLAEKKQDQQNSIEKRRLDTQKVLDELNNDKENNNNDTENNENNKNPKVSKTPFSTANSKSFQSETTNTSTFKRWPKSAFQTVASRSAEKPIWAAHNGSQHFPVKAPRHKVLKDSTKHNMNITLTIDGKSMGSRSVPKVGTDFKKQQKNNSNGRNKSKFQSEYQSKFKKPGYV